MSSDHNRGIFQIGDVLNNTYRIDKVLGRGGTSEVYRAKSEISGRVVAIKALRTEFSRNEDFLALMTREEDMREIRHDAVVRYYDNQRTDDGHVYLVMDYVDGPGLDRKIKEGGMSADDLMIVCRRVAEGLVAAHAKNIVHRDMSPDNIILRDGLPSEAVIIDFGIAKDTNPGAETIVGNEFAGKYAYAAPEQLSGQTDARADVYALGALLLSTYRGAAPDIGNNPMEVIEKKSEPLDTSGVPEPLKSLIDRMTHPTRDQRLQTAQAVLDEVKAPGSGTPPAASETITVDDQDRTVIVPRSAKKAPYPVKKVSGPKESPARAKHATNETKKTNRALLPALAAVALAVVGIVLFFSGALNGLFGPTLPHADPFSLTASRTESGQVQAVGYMPDQANYDSLVSLISRQGGTSDLSLAQGDITQTWAPDILRIIETVSHISEWRVLADAARVRITGLTNDRAELETLTNTLMQDKVKGAFEVTVDIELGPRFLSEADLDLVLKQHQNCGELNVIDPPAAGYGTGSQVIVAGRVADIESRTDLSNGLVASIGPRDLVLEVEVLNETLCLVENVLPNAPEVGFDIQFRTGSEGNLNDWGHYIVGQNPVIDIVIPADVTDGYLFVSALDVSGNVFHLLPNLLMSENNVAAIRDGREGPIGIRVAHVLSDAADGKKLAFFVDDTSLGKTKIIVIHSKDQIFDGMRPTTESAGGFVDALRKSTGVVTSLDSRILTTALQ